MNRSEGKWDGNVIPVRMDDCFFQFRKEEIRRAERIEKPVKDFSEGKRYLAPRGPWKC